MNSKIIEVKGPIELKYDKQGNLWMRCRDAETKKVLAHWANEGAAGESIFISMFLPAFQEIQPSDVGALTSAPMIKSCPMPEGERAGVYAYMDYQVRSFLQELSEGAEVKWQFAEIEEKGEQKHSPLPWHSAKTGASMLTYNQSFGIFNLPPVNLIAGVFRDGEGGPQQAEANAKFICQAVNSHYELVEALREVLRPYSKEEIEECPQLEYALKVLKKVGAKV